MTYMYDLRRLSPNSVDATPTLGSRLSLPSIASVHQLVILQVSGRIACSGGVSRSLRRAAQHCSEDFDDGGQSIQPVQPVTSSL